MADILSERIFFETIDRLRQDFQASHSRLRQDMGEGFRELSDKLDQHAKEDLAVDRRVQRIEVEREGEKSATLKQGTWAALIGASVLTAAWEGVKKLAGW